MPFKIQWPIPSREVLAHFLTNADYWKDHGLPGNDGISIKADFKSDVLACADGTVKAIEQPGDVRPYGNTITLEHAADGVTFTTTYCHLFRVDVAVGDTVSAGDVIGAAGGAGSLLGTEIKVILKRVGAAAAGQSVYVLPSGAEVTMPGDQLDPADYLHPAPSDRYAQPKAAPSATATFKEDLNIRDLPSTRGRKLYTAKASETLQVLAVSEDGDWYQIAHNDNEGWCYAEYIDYHGDRSALAVKHVELPEIKAAGGRNGVNLDMQHPLGKPSIDQLGTMDIVRLGYNVSMGKGNQDLKRAYDLYAPYVEALAAAGIEVVFVYTHQTFGEGAGYDWNQMSPQKWDDLSSRFADFVGKIAAQYSTMGNIAAHQIWNEQDAHHGAVASVPLTPRVYGMMLGKTIPAVRAADATTPIITGGHASGPGNGSRYARETIAAMPAGVEHDGIAFHPYGRGVTLPSKYAHFGPIEESVTTYWDVQGKPLWITEWGVLNAPGEPPNAIRDYAVDVLDYLDKRHPDKIAATIWYAWAEGMHNGYGLVDRNGNSKPDIFDTFTSWAYKFAKKVKEAAEQD